jgi:hypothetical protein
VTVRLLFAVLLVLPTVTFARTRHALPEFDSIAPIAGEPVWVAAPMAEDVRRNHPIRAAEREVRGAVDLLCRVRDDAGTLGCAVASEDPGGYGFGSAALHVADLYRIAPVIDGQATVGRRVSVRVDFSNLPDIPTCSELTCGNPSVLTLPASAAADR